MKSHNTTAEVQERTPLMRLTPVLVFVLLASLTLLIWRQQQQHQHRLLASRTEDVCLQSARRIQVLMDAALQNTTLFAQVWLAHKRQVIPRDRYKPVAKVFVERLVGYHAMHLIHTDGSVWDVPPATGTWAKQKKTLLALLPEARRRRQVLLSPPFKDRPGHTDLFALQPLLRGEQLLGYLVVELDMETLIGHGFHRRIRSGFDLRVTDGAATLFRTRPPDRAAPTDLRFTVRHDFAVRNRGWRISATPQASVVAAASWRANLSMPLLGLALSVGLAFLVYLLSRRREQYWAARDRALREAARRVKAQRNLRISEDRYRSVFNSASDGLLVLDDAGMILEANPTACSMHGYQPEEFHNFSVEQIIAPGHKQQYELFRSQLKEFGNARVDSVNRRHDGDCLHVEVRGTRFDFGGEPRVLAIIRDVSEHRRALDRLALLSRKVLMAQEDERARLSRELHDELGQILTALHLEIDWLQRKARTDSAAAVGGLKDAGKMVAHAADELRSICKGLRPPLLDDLGLEPAAGLLVDEFRERGGIEILFEVKIDEDSSIPPEVALCTYRILQESLHNASRHAGANNVAITLVDDEQTLRLSVYDDGSGFDLDTVEHKGCGLDGMRERALLVDGELTITSEHLQGTRVVFRHSRGSVSKEEG